MKVGFDLDNTLCDTNGKIAEILKKDFDADIPENPDKFDLIANYTNLPKDRHQAYFEHLCRNNLYKEIPPLPKFVSVFNRCLKAGLEVYIVTARHGDSIEYNTLNIIGEDTLAWLSKNVPDFNLKNLVFTKGSKASAIEALDLDLFIDDRSKHAQEASAECTSILINKSYNIFDSSDSYIRIDTAEEIPELIERHLGVAI